LYDFYKENNFIDINEIIRQKYVAWLEFTSEQMNIAK
jgi:hypothetical protein